MLKVNVSGIEQIDKNMSEIEKKLIKTLNGVLIASAFDLVETVAKKKITQDKHIDTGRLRASIHTTYKGKEHYSYSDDEGEAFNSRLDVKRKEHNVFVGTDVEYATKIEALDSYLHYAHKNSKAKIDRRLKKAMDKVLKG